MPREYAAARAAGLPVELTDQGRPAYPIVRAVRLTDQLALDPVRYAYGLPGSTRAVVVTQRHALVG